MKDKSFDCKGIIIGIIIIIICILIAWFTACKSLKFPDKAPSGNDWYWENDTLKIG